MKNLVLALLFLLAISPVFAGNNDGDKAKTRTVSGRIVDQNGETLPGASITIKETGEQFFADLDGNFQITIPAKDAFSVRISTIGFQNKEFKSFEFLSFTEYTLEPHN